MRSNILDTSAILALFEAYPPVLKRVADAEAGRLNLVMPAASIADAEAHVRAGTDGWEGVLLTRGLASLPLTEHAAIEVGQWPGDLATRHAVHEAQALGGLIVTRKPGVYEGHQVALVVV